MKNEYFIIESLTEEDITDGQIFYDALKKRHDPIYIKVRNPKQFRQALKEFCGSDYRHLFISAHGDDENIILSDGNFNAYDLEDLRIDFLNGEFSCRPAAVVRFYSQSISLRKEPILLSELQIIYLR